MLRVVFDTNVVVSALLFTNGRLAWLRESWASRQSVPIISKETIGEVLRVLAYPRFQLDRQQVDALLADYLPFAEAAQRGAGEHGVLCRDANDQMLLDLAFNAGADVLVTGDNDLLALAERFAVVIEPPHAFHERCLAK